MINGVSHTGIDRGSQSIPTLSPSNSPVHLSSLPTTISVSNHSAVNSSKPFSFKKLFCNNRLIRTIAWVVSNILFYIRSIPLGSYLLGSHPFQNAPLHTPLQMSNPETPKTSLSKASTDATVEEPRPIEPLFSTEGLTLEYVQEEYFGTCIINEERFALIDDRSIQYVTSKGAGNIVINLPNHHLVILNPISAPMLTLEGKSVTLITSLTIAGDLIIKVPKSTGKIIFYGGTSTVNVKGNGTVVAKEFIQKGSRIETIYIEENGHVQDEIVDYLAIIKDLFQKGITTQSSATITLALLKAGYEILFSEDQEISRSDIFNLWGIPLQSKELS